MKKVVAVVIFTLSAVLLFAFTGPAWAAKDHIRIGLADVPVGVDFYATISNLYNIIYIIYCITF